MTNMTYVLYLEALVLSLLDERPDQDAEIKSTDPSHPSWDPAHGITFAPILVRECIAKHRDGTAVNLRTPYADALVGFQEALTKYGMTCYELRTAVARGATPLEPLREAQAAARLDCLRLFNTILTDLQERETHGRQAAADDHLRLPHGGPGPAGPGPIQVMPG